MEKLESFLKDVESMSCNALTVSQKALSDDSKEVTLNLASKKIMPDRMESPARAHIFHDAAGFADYLKANKSENLLVLIDTDRKTVAAVLDDKAEKGFEVVQFKPPYHPKFNLFNEHLLGQFEVKEFAQGVMMCRDLIAGVDGDEKYVGKQLALLMKQITVSNKVTAEHGTGVSCVNGVMVETNLKAGGNSSKDEIDLPETIVIRTPIFLNTDPKTFDLMITVAPVSPERVIIMTAAPELPVIQHELFDEMLVDVTNITGAIVTYGTVSATDWKYNR